LVAGADDVDLLAGGAFDDRGPALTVRMV